jgi:transposase
MAKEIFVGIDISKDHLDVHVLPDNVEFSCTRDEKGLRILVKSLKEMSPVLIVLEATGGYQNLVAAGLGAALLPFSVVNPARIRHFARAIGKLAKTDALDAYVIARYAEAIKPAPQALPGKEQTTMKELIARRRQLVKILAAEKNHLKTVSTGSLRARIESFLETIDQEIRAINEDLDAVIRSRPDWSEKDQLLQSVPGVGSNTSRTLLSDLPELGTLNRQKIASLVGIAPMNRDSGQMRGKRMITGGRPSVRNMLYMATVASLRSNPKIAPFYRRLREAGKPAKVAIVAAMRKLLVMLNAILKSKTAFMEVMT